MILWFIAALIIHIYGLSWLWWIGWLLSGFARFWVYVTCETDSRAVPHPSHWDHTKP